MRRSAIVEAMRGPFYAADITEPGTWPNVPDPGSVPRVEVAWADPDRTSPTLDRTAAVIERGRLILTAVGPPDDGEDETNARADALAEAYPADSRLTGVGCLIVIGLPLVRAGYRDGPEWRVPVVIPYVAYNQ